MRRDKLLLRSGGLAAAVFAGLLMLATSGQAAVGDGVLIGGVLHESSLDPAADEGWNANISPVGTADAGPPPNWRMTQGAAVNIYRIRDFDPAPMQTTDGYTATFTLKVPQSEVQWRTGVVGDWNAFSNWSPSMVPDATTITAIFGDVIQQSRTVFTDADVTVKGIQFLDLNTYNVSGTGSINLNSGTSAPTAPTNSSSNLLPTKERLKNNLAIVPSPQ